MKKNFERPDIRVKLFGDDIRTTGTGGTGTGGTGTGTGGYASTVYARDKYLFSGGQNTVHANWGEMLGYNE